MEYPRKVDFKALDAAKVHFNQGLLDGESGASSVIVQIVKNPAGTGSSHKMHTHKFEQIHYVISGTLGMEIDGKKAEAGPGTLVVIPAGTPHENTVIGSEPAIFVNILTPLSAYEPH